MILPAWFDYLQESFSHKEDLFKTFACLRKPVALLLKLLMKPLSFATGPNFFLLFAAFNLSE